MVRRGVYFLADDGVLAWAAAFLCSFRRYNSDLPLCLIPYNDRIERLRELQARYRFTVFEDQRIFDICETIAEPFHPDYGKGHYRKLACWEGPFDEFVYIDVDTIVQGAFDVVFDCLRQYDFTVAVSNRRDLVQWVWKPTIAASGALSPEQIAYSASTGFIVSRKEALSTSEVLAKLEPAASLAPHMVLLCVEQPLLNYLIVTSGRRISSLSRLGSCMPQEWYAGSGGATVREGQLRFRGKPPLHVHWPGQQMPSPPPSRLSQADGAQYRINARTEARDMPYYDLWKYYWDRA